MIQSDKWTVCDDPPGVQTAVGPDSKPHTSNLHLNDTLKSHAASLWTNGQYLSDIL